MDFLNQLKDDIQKFDKLENENKGVLTVILHACVILYNLIES